MSDQPELIIPRGLITNSPEAAEVGKAYRRKAVPDFITNEELGRYYLNLDALRPVPPGTSWPDSTRPSMNGASCWPTWVIFQDPADLSAKFVARLFVFSMPTPHIITADTLEGVRDKLPPGLRRWERSSIDSRALVESWM